MLKIDTVCPYCKMKVEVSFRNAIQQALCPYCHTMAQHYIFPALFRPVKAVVRSEKAVLTDESTCFNHGDKRAIAVCEHCGRFVCSLCEVPAQGSQPCLCVECFEESIKEGEGNSTSTRRVYMDEIALAIGLIGTLIIYFAVFTIPICTFIILRYWKVPQSVTPRGRWRFVVAGLLSFIQLVILVGIGYMFSLSFRQAV